MRGAEGRPRTARGPLLGAAVAVAGAAGRVLAHGAQAHPPGPAVLRWTDWSADPPVLAGAALLWGAYAWVVRRFPVSRRRRGSFLTGLAVAVLAIESPLDRGADHFLFTLHMLQHTFLTVVVPLLLLGGLPTGSLERALGDRIMGGSLGRRAAAWGRVWTRSALPATVVYNVYVAAWHLPVLYEAALDSETVHALQHLGFVAAGLGLWSAVLAPSRRRPAGSPVMGIAAATVTLLVNWLISFALAAGGRPLYVTYATAPRLWGLSPEGDMALGAGLMWTMGNMVYGAAILHLARSAVRLDAAAARPDGRLRGGEGHRGAGMAGPAVDSGAPGRRVEAVPPGTLPSRRDVVAGAAAVLLLAGGWLLTGRAPDAAPVEVRAVARGTTWYFVTPGPDGRAGRLDPSLGSMANPAGLDPADPAAADDQVATVLEWPRERRAILRATAYDGWHTFSVPALGIHETVAPGRWTSVRLGPARPGSYRVVCAQVCGMDDTLMQADLRVR